MDRLVCCSRHHISAKPATVAASGGTRLRGKRVAARGAVQGRIGCRSEMATELASRSTDGASWRVAAGFVPSAPVCERPSANQSVFSTTNNVPDLDAEVVEKASVDGSR